MPLQWERLWSIGRYDLHLSEVEFWGLTMREVSVLIDRYNEDMERQDYHAALVCAVLANINRDPKREAFTPSDFMPSYSQESKDERDKEELDYLLELGAALGAAVVVSEASESEVIVNG